MTNSGLDIRHIRRSTRVGFKAGALAHGLKSAKGEFIAVFVAEKENTGNFRELHPGFDIYSAQRGIDLGERMKAAFAELLGRRGGADRRS